MDVQAEIHDDGSTLVITFTNFDQELNRKANVEIALLKSLGSYQSFPVHKGVHQLIR